MRKTVAIGFLAIIFLLAGMLTSAQATTAPISWPLSYAGVGPAKITMTTQQAEASGYFSAGGCGPQLKGAPGKVVFAWFGGSRQTLQALFVTAPSSGNYRFATRTGVRVGSTVAQLKRGEAGLTLSTKKVYTAHAPGGFAYVYYQHSGPAHWMMYALPSTLDSPRAIKPTTKLTEIAVSSYRLGAMGGC